MKGGKRDKNDGNEVVDNCDLPLDLEFTERVEVDDETQPYAEEDWDCPEQTEIDKGVQPDLPFTMETRQGKKGGNKEKDHPYGGDFVVNRIVLSDMMDSLVGLDEVAVPKEIDLVNDMDQDWIDDRSEPDLEFEAEAEQIHEQELTILRVLERLHNLPADPKETILTTQIRHQICQPLQYRVQLGRSRWPSTRPAVQPRSARLWAIDGDVDGYFCP